MAVFRIEKTKDYTVMSNYHLKDRELSCKACGLLSKMLSLPEDWDYTTRGLATICKDGVDSIGSALKELETRGYLVRNRLRDEKGRIRDTEYVIYETPHPPDPDTVCPDTGNPDMDTPDTAEPGPENPAQLNTKESNTQKSITHPSNTHSFLPPEPDGLTDGMEVREEIKDQIDYDALLTDSNQPELDELVEIMVEVAMNRSPTIKIGRDAEYATAYVQDRFRRITTSHIEKVMEGIRENTTRVWNTKAYLLSALFNSVSTVTSHYTMLVNHDMYGKKARNKLLSREEYYRYEPGESL